MYVHLHWLDGAIRKSTLCLASSGYSALILFYALFYFYLDTTILSNILHSPKNIAAYLANSVLCVEKCKIDACIRLCLLQIISVFQLLLLLYGAVGCKTSEML